MSADSPRHTRMGGPLTVPSQPPSDRSLMDTVSGFINDVTLTSTPGLDPRDTILWARFESADVNEPTPEGDSEAELSPLLLILGYGSGVQVWVIPPNGEAQEALSWRQGTVRVLRILPTPIYADSFGGRRPLIALCDSAGPGPAYCSLSFISVRGGDQVKSIKFKNPVLDVVANKRSVVVSFAERFAVFDGATLEDRLAVTTCYPSPCPLGGSTPINPIALGDRWLAFADKKLNQSKRSSGGCEGEGVTSYTATVLHAAKSLSKGLRGLGESVASSLAGGRGGLSQSPSPPNAEHQQPGIVTILDIEGLAEDEQDSDEAYDATVAHFVAHSEAVIALKFDASGLLLVTADRRGHDFHVFRVHPHPCGPSLASVHHLYILHRGDTTSKVQDIALSLDSRWAAISTLRGTTHVFPLTTYGGPCGVRTHTQPRVVNRLSRFHRSAGLAIDGRSSSPVGDGPGAGAWFANPRVPPYPAPTTLTPLAQVRPSPGAAGALPTHTITRNSAGRQRLSSLSEEGQPPLAMAAWWGPAPPRPSPPSAVRGTAPPRSGAQALYVMSANGYLLQYCVCPRAALGVPKEKVCDDTPIELEVEAKAQWPLSRPASAPDLTAPLPPGNPLLTRPFYKNSHEYGTTDEDRWLSQVEIITHAGPHRRLWMGPQFVFKTYNTNMGSTLSLLDVDAVEVGTGPPVTRSNPVNMPGARPIVPVLIESGSASSLEHSPSDSFRRKSFILEGGSKPVADKSVICDVQLREDLAEAMRDTEQGWSSSGPRESGDGRAVARVVNPLGTVVAGCSPGSSPPSDDPDLYTRSNDDETLFRPVVRAPKSISPPCQMFSKPLSTCTVIPVKKVFQTKMPDNDDEDKPLPLKTEVIIPAALSGKCVMSRVEDMESDEFVGEVVGEVKVKSRKVPPKVTEVVPMKVNESDSSEMTKSAMSVDKVEIEESKISLTSDKTISITESRPDDKNEINIRKNSVSSSHSKMGTNKRTSKTSKSPSPKRKVVPVETLASTEQKLTKDDNKENVVQSSVREEKESVSEAFTVSLPIPVKRTSKPIPRDIPPSESPRGPTPIKDTPDVQKVTIENDEPKQTEDSKVRNRRGRKNKGKPLPDNKIGVLLNQEEIDEPEAPQKLVPEDVSVIPEFKEKNVWRDLPSTPKLDIYLNTERDNKSSKGNLETSWGSIASSSLKAVEIDVDTVLLDKEFKKEKTPEIKSWSSIASGKFTKSKTPTKPFDEISTSKQNIDSSDAMNLSSNSEKTIKHDVDKTEDGEIKMELPPTLFKDRKKTPKLSLPHKLAEIYKRDDFVVAECDSPRELTFVEEYHSMNMEVPKVGDFALDEIKLEVMKDSLLDIEIKQDEKPKMTMDDYILELDDAGGGLLSEINRRMSLANNTFDIVSYEESQAILSGTLDYSNVISSEGFMEHHLFVPPEIVKIDSGKLSLLMDKSSDEENTSPLSSQTDSDDKEERRSAPTMLVPIPSQKVNKKKPKRKRK